MDRLTLEATQRIPGRPRHDRRQGLIPAIVYGHGGPSQPIAVERSAVIRFLAGGSAHGIFDLKVSGEGEPRTVMLKELHTDPIRGDVMHMDFYQVSLTEKVTTSVPLRIIGDDKVPADGVLQHQMHELDIECLPRDLPEFIDVDVTELGLGDSIFVQDLAPGDGIEILNDPEQVIVSVVVSRLEEEDEEIDEVIGEPELVDDAAAAGGDEDPEQGS